MSITLQNKLLPNCKLMAWQVFFLYLSLKDEIYSNMFYPYNTS